MLGKDSGNNGSTTENRSQQYSVLDFTVLGGDSGSLIALEAGREVPFEIKRVYYVYNTTKDVLRGKHAHKKLEQLLFCPSGSCDFMLDDGEKKEYIRMDRPNKGLYINGYIWREFTNFSPNCVVMVLASLPYDESEYIRNYNDFVNGISQWK